MCGQCITHEIVLLEFIFTQNSRFSGHLMVQLPELLGDHLSPLLVHHTGSAPRKGLLQVQILLFANRFISWDLISKYYFLLDRFTS